MRKLDSDILLVTYEVETSLGLFQNTTSEIFPPLCSQDIAFNTNANDRMKQGACLIESHFKNA